MSGFVLFGNTHDQENRPPKRMKISDSVSDIPGKEKALDSVVKNTKINVEGKENCKKKKDDGNDCDRASVLGLKARIHHLKTLRIVTEEDVGGQTGEKRKNQVGGQSDIYGKLSRQLTNYSLKNIQVLDILGKGGFATVYKVKVEPARGVCALKLRWLAPKDSRQKDKLELEFLVQQKIKHENIVRALESFQMPGATCFMMELCPNGSLLDYVCGNAFPKTDARSKRYAINVIDGLVHLQYVMGYLHMDLKLENVLVSENDVAKISDFGCALRMHTFRTWMKMSQWQGGTRLYSPPEILRKLGFDSTLDVWCVACIVHELMLGRHPFYEGSVESDLHCHTASMKAGDGLIRMIAAFKGKLFTDSNLPRSRHLKNFLESILSKPHSERPLSTELKNSLWFR